MQHTNMGEIAEGSGNWFATAEDFCVIFREQVETLYVLSLLLTGDHEKAEQCFLAAFSDCLQTTYIFREWAPSWAKRVIIRRATEILRPHPEDTTSRTPDSVEVQICAMPTLREQHFGQVLALGTFERFVLVLSVLEKYSERDCARLLGCSFEQIRTTRISALQQIAEPASNAFPDGAQIEPNPDRVSRLATEVA